MYFLIIFILLALSVATLFLSKTYPVFKLAGGILPIAAILILIFKPGSPNTLPVSKQVLNEEARGVGEQLARAITRTIPQPGGILVIHPAENSSVYLLSRIQEQLQGLGDSLESTDYTLTTHYLTEADAVNDPLTEGTFIGSPTLSRLAANQYDPVGVVLLGLNLTMGDEQPAANLPPLVLTTVGDPATSEGALYSGLAVAALFEKISAPLSSLQDKTLTAEERFNHRFEIRTSNQ